MKVMLKGGDEHTHMLNASDKIIVKDAVKNELAIVRTRLNTCMLVLGEAVLGSLKCHSGENNTSGDQGKDTIDVDGIDAATMKKEEMALTAYIVSLRSSSQQVRRPGGSGSMVAASASAASSSRARLGEAPPCRSYAQLKIISAQLERNTIKNK